MSERSRTRLEVRAGAASGAVLTDARAASASASVRERTR